jgi:hypothetical protein
MAPGPMSRVFQKPISREEVKRRKGEKGSVRFASVSFPLCVRVVGWKHTTLNSQLSTPNF